MFLLPSTLAAALVRTLVKRPEEMLCPILGNVVCPEGAVPSENEKLTEEGNGQGWRVLKENTLSQFEKMKYFYFV